MNIAFKTINKAHTVKELRRMGAREMKVTATIQSGIEMRDKHILYSSGHKPIQGMPNSLKGNIHHK